MFSAARIKRQHFLFSLSNKVETIHKYCGISLFHCILYPFVRDKEKSQTKVSSRLELGIFYPPRKIRNLPQKEMCKLPRNNK